MSERWALRLSGVSKRYRTFTLADVTLDLAAGEVLGLVGANGSGKTTLLRLALGTTRPDAGHVEHRVTSDGAARRTGDAPWRRDLAFVSSSCAWPRTMTPREARRLMELSYPGFDPSVFAKRCEELGIAGKLEGTSLGQLSQGAGLALQLALALATGARVLLMDEGLSGLDVTARERALGCIQDWMETGERSAVISAHDTRGLERICDRVAFLAGGRLAACMSPEAITDEMAVAHLRERELAELAAHKPSWPSHQVPEPLVLSRALSTDVLVADRSLLLREHPTWAQDPATIDDVLRFLSEGKPLEGTPLAADSARTAPQAPNQKGGTP